MNERQDSDLALDVMNMDNLGASLARMRELRELSIEEVAHRLRLRSATIELMESKSFPGDMPEVFAKGHLKSYARLLQFSENDIKAMVSLLDSQFNNVSTTFFSKPMAVKLPKRLIMILTGLLVLIMIAIFIVYTT